MADEIARLLSFRLSGRFAHFRKFYTNASSLSYLVPPRTTIIGMLASILKYRRDTYYDEFSPKRFKISVAIAPGTLLKTQMQSLNYLHEKYHRFYKGKSEKDTFHSQCKLELLSVRSGSIVYQIYVGACHPEALPTLNTLEDKIKRRDFGCGIYLGQRPFRAFLDQVACYDAAEIRYMDKAGQVDSICMQANVDKIDTDRSDIQLIIDQVPIHLRHCVSAKNGDHSEGRELQSSGRVVYEKSGQRITGRFRNCYALGERVISFYEFTE